MNNKEYLDFRIDKQHQQSVSSSYAADVELSQAEHDKITNLCNVYGLNQEQTRQLIEELKAGGNLVIDKPAQIPIKESSTNSIPGPSALASSSSMTTSKGAEQDPFQRKQPSIVETRNDELSFNDSEFKFEEEYSFKQTTRRDPHLQAQQEQSFERMLMNKLKYEEEYYQKIRQENELLKAEKQELSTKVNTLLKIKEQDSEMMLGLKNTICSLTTLLKDKQAAFSELQENYYKLANSIQNREAPNPLRQSSVPNQRLSELVAPKNRILEKRESRQNILTENSSYLKESNVINTNNNSSNIQRRQSKEFQKTKSTTNFFPQKDPSPAPMRKSTLNNRENTENSYIENLKTEASCRPESKYGQLSKKQKVDIGKYKVFIDQLRSICVNKQKNL